MGSSMQCDICGKKKATVHLTEIVDEQMSEMHLCEECARNKSSQMEQQFGLGDLLAGLSADVGKGAAKADDKHALKCSSCGLNYEDFRKFGRLGCGQCYVSFKENLSGLLRKIHGSNRHLGKTPMNVKLAGTALAAPESASSEVSTADHLDELKKSLHSAIAAEDFEKAAKLRDKIRKIEHS